MKDRWYLVGYKDKNKPNEIVFGQPKMLYEGGDCTSRSYGYETEQELREKGKITFNCSKCGGPASLNYSACISDRLESQKICLSCDFWLNEVDHKNSVRIDGSHFQIGPDYPKGYRGSLGFGGREFHIEFNDGRRVVTHNLWSQGEIPDRFRDILPDNAKFSNGEGWGEVGGIRCMRAGEYLNGVMDN
jgi:hypothetical protein